MVFYSEIFPEGQTLKDVFTGSADISNDPRFEFAVLWALRGSYLHSDELLEKSLEERRGIIEQRVRDNRFLVDSQAVSQDLHDTIVTIGRDVDVLAALNEERPIPADKAKEIWRAYKNIWNKAQPVKTPEEISTARTLQTPGKNAFYEKVKAGYDHDTHTLTVGEIRYDLRNQTLYGIEKQFKKQFSKLEPPHEYAYIGFEGLGAPKLAAQAGDGVQYVHIHDLTDENVYSGKPNQVFMDHLKGLKNSAYAPSAIAPDVKFNMYGCEQ